MTTYFRSIHDFDNSGHYAQLAYNANPNYAQTVFNQSLVSAFKYDSKGALSLLDQVKFLDPSEL